MDILERAKELGTMIGNSQQMEKLKNAEAKVEVDEKSKTLLNDYKLLQVELVKATREKRSEDIIKSIRERLLQKQEEINNYNITSDYFECKTTFDSFMKQINDVIIYAITGEEPCSPKKCGSCGGGCK